MTDRLTESGGHSALTNEESSHWPSIDRWFVALSLLYMSLIFYLSSQERLGEGAMSWWLEFLHSYPGGDKVTHAIEYAGLGFLLWKALGSAIRAFLVGALYGASDEFHQWFVPGREAGVPDWIADLFGVSIGIVVAINFFPWFERRWRARAEASRR